MEAFEEKSWMTLLSGARVNVDERKRSPQISRSGRLRRKASHGGRARGKGQARMAYRVHGHGYQAIWANRSTYMAEAQT